MQTIIFKRTSAETDFTQAANWDEKLLDHPVTETLQNGTIVVVKKSDFSILCPVIDKRGVLNFGIKNPKVELFRALKFDQIRDREIPRRLIINFFSIGAFKRSFFPFFYKRYRPTDPPCFLFVTDERVDELVKFTQSQPKKTVTGDPMSMLLEDTAQGEMADKIGKVYIGESYAIKLARTMICKAALSESPVLILGESGTGKELIARQIFEHSTKLNKDLFIINCSAIPDTLLESELFGHKKGIFTDAKENKEGLFIAANGGTLFLDEIGDLSQQNQAKVLRAIDEKEVRAIGSNKTIKVKVRIIAATNRNLASMMKQKSFREDLYYRLNSLTIFAPPLREHPDDIPRIAMAIWKKLDKPGKLSDIFLNYLKSYSWPGNVRELKTLLNTISDLFEGISPGPEHIEAIRTYQKKTLVESTTTSEDDFNKMLKAQCKNRIIEVQNILRAIKIELRPIINKQLASLESEKLARLKDFIQGEVNKLENLCREPIFFKNRIMFDRIKRFRYILEKTLNDWPISTDELRNLWQTDLNPLYENIDREIFDMIWGKMDL
jgi:DNA-binding NtrC family response regulator